MIEKVEEGLENYKKAVRDYLYLARPHINAHGDNFVEKLPPLQRFVFKAELSRLMGMANALALTEEEIENIQKEVMGESAQVKTE